MTYCTQYDIMCLLKNVCHGDTRKGFIMNILHCSKCGRDLIVNMRYPLTLTKKMILTDEGWDELSDRVDDECSSEPFQIL